MPAEEEDLVPDNFDLNLWVLGAGGSLGGGPSDPCQDYNSPAHTGDGDEGKHRFSCDPVLTPRYQDPILFPGQEFGAHLHQFIGNTLAGKDSTYQSLRETGDGTCQGGPANRTGYWYPAMIRPQGPGTNGGSVVLPFRAQFYYAQHRKAAKGWTCNSGFSHVGVVQPPARKYPRGLRFIWGWPFPDSQGTRGASIVGDGDGSIEQGVANWRRYVWSRPQNGTGASYITLADMAAVETNPATNDNIQFRFSAPVCWDGESLDGNGDGRSHMRFASSGNCCPSGWQRIPEILMIVEFPHNGPADFGQWFIASDQGHGPPHETYIPGETLHADWYGAWSSPLIDDMITDRMLGVNSPTPGVVMGACNGGGLWNDDKFTKVSHLWVNTNTTRPEGTVVIANPATHGFRYADIPEAPEEPEIPASTIRFQWLRH